MDLASLARSIRLLLVSLVGVAAAAHVQACGSGDGLMSVVDDDAGRPIGRSDASASGDDASASLATMRLAHLASDLGTIDFCYAALTGASVGPVLNGGGADPDASVDASDAADAGSASADAAGGGLDGAAPDASPAGLAFGTVTKYFTLQATGTINVAIVRAGATSCSNPIAEGTVTLDPGKLSTVALFAAPAVAGDAGDAGARALVAFIDDRETRADRARVRMVHGASAGPLAVQVTGATTVSLAERLEPRRVSTASQTIPVDALGFATIAPVAPPASFVIAATPIDGGPSDASWQSAAADLDLRGDSLHTGFVLDDTGGGFSVLWCADKSTTAELTACSLLR